MSVQHKEISIPKQPGSQYTDDQRIAVLADYFVTGNITKTANMHNMPKQTVSNWAKSDWGVELLGQLRTENGEQFDANLTRFIDAAFEQAQDRVENGDYRVTKDGKLFRVPMGGYQLVISGSTAYDKRQLHRNQPTSITKNAPGLDAMVKKFEAIADAYNERQKRVVSVQEKSEEESS